MALSRHTKQLTSEQFIEEYRGKVIYQLRIKATSYSDGKYFFDEASISTTGIPLYQVNTPEISLINKRRIKSDIEFYKWRQQIEFTVVALFETPQEAYRALRLLNHKYSKYLSK